MPKAFDDPENMRLDCFFAAFMLSFAEALMLMTKYLKRMSFLRKQESLDACFHSHGIL